VRANDTQQLQMLPIG